MLSAEALSQNGYGRKTNMLTKRRPTIKKTKTHVFLNCRPSRKCNTKCKTRCKTKILSRLRLPRDEPCGMEEIPFYGKKCVGQGRNPDIPIPIDAAMSGDLANRGCGKEVQPRMFYKRTGPVSIISTTGPDRTRKIDNRTGPNFINRTEQQQPDRTGPTFLNLT